MLACCSGSFISRKFSKASLRESNSTLAARLPTGLTEGLAHILHRTFNHTRPHREHQRRHQLHLTVSRHTNTVSSLVIAQTPLCQGNVNDLRQPILHPISQQPRPCLTNPSGTLAPAPTAKAPDHGMALHPILGPCWRQSWSTRLEYYTMVRS